MDFGSILPTILENLSKLLPVRMIDDNQQGIRRTWGKSCGPYEAGPLFFIPLVQSIESYGITDGPIDFGSQPLSLAKNGTITVKSGLIYRIHNAFLYAKELGDEDSAAAVCTVGRGIVAEKLCVIDTLEEIRTKKSKLEEEIARAINKRIETWGLTAREYYISELALTQHYSITGEQRLPLSTTLSN
ncbi:MAG: SPFH domain-containing protein [Nanoarchaeota archaeon]